MRVSAFASMLELFVFVFENAFAKCYEPMINNELLKSWNSAQQLQNAGNINALQHWKVKNSNTLKVKELKNESWEIGNGHDGLLLNRISYRTRSS